MFDCFVNSGTSHDSPEINFMAMLNLREGKALTGTMGALTKCKHPDKIPLSLRVRGTELRHYLTFLNLCSLYMCN